MGLEHFTEFRGGKKKSRKHPGQVATVLMQLEHWGKKNKNQQRHQAKKAETKTFSAPQSNVIWKAFASSKSQTAGEMRLVCCLVKNNNKMSALKNVPGTHPDSHCSQVAHVFKQTQAGTSLPAGIFGWSRLSPQRLTLARHSSQRLAQGLPFLIDVLEILRIFTALC